MIGEIMSEEIKLQKQKEFLRDLVSEIAKEAKGIFYEYKMKIAPFEEALVAIDLALDQCISLEGDLNLKETLIVDLDVLSLKAKNSLINGKDIYSTSYKKEYYPKKYEIKRTQRQSVVKKLSTAYDLSKLSNNDLFYYSQVGRKAMIQIKYAIERIKNEPPEGGI